MSNEIDDPQRASHGDEPPDVGLLSTIQDALEAEVGQGRDDAARQALEDMDTADMQVDLALARAKNAVQKRPAPW
jgi:hypothetical protein